MDSKDNKASGSMPSSVEGSRVEDKEDKEVDMVVDSMAWDKTAACSKVVDSKGAGSTVAGSKVVDKKAAYNTAADNRGAGNMV